MTTLGERIKLHRKEKGLTQKELASKLGIAEITLRQYENNKREPNNNMLINIANTLNIKLADLVLDPYDLSEFYNQLIDKRDEYSTIASITNLLQFLNIDGINKVKNYTIDLIHTPEYLASPNEKIIIQDLIDRSIRELIPPDNYKKVHTD